MLKLDGLKTLTLKLVERFSASRARWLSLLGVVKLSPESAKQLALGRYAISLEDRVRESVQLFLPDDNRNRMIEYDLP